MLSLRSGGLIHTFWASGAGSSHSRAPGLRVAGGMMGPADSSWTHHALASWGSQRRYLMRAMQIDGDFTTMKGRATIGAVNVEVNVADRLVTDSVAQGSYNYAETTVRGLAARREDGPYE